MTKQEAAVNGQSDMGVNSPLLEMEMGQKQGQSIFFRPFGYLTGAFFSDSIIKATRLFIAPTDFYCWISNPSASIMR